MLDALEITPRKPLMYDYDRNAIEAVQYGFRRLQAYARHVTACEEGLRIVEAIERDLVAPPPEHVDLAGALEYTAVP